MPESIYPQHVLDAYSNYLRTHPSNNPAPILGDEDIKQLYAAHQVTKRQSIASPTPPQSGTIQNPTLNSPAPMSQDMYDWITTAPTDNSLHDDINNPRRFVDFKDIPNAEQIAASIAHHLDGPNARPYMPQHIGIYGGSSPSMISGSTSTLPPYNSNMSAHDMVALMTKDQRPKSERYPDLFSNSDIQARNPNIFTDPTWNAQNTFAHELTHQYIQRRRMQYLDYLYWQRQNPNLTPSENNFLTSGLYDEGAQATHPVDLDRLQPLQKDFREPFYNSHSTGFLSEKAAAIMGHQIGAEQLNIHP